LSAEIPIVADESGGVVVILARAGNDGGHEVVGDRRRLDVRYEGPAGRGPLERGCTLG